MYCVVENCCLNSTTKHAQNCSVICLLIGLESDREVERWNYYIYIARFYSIPYFNLMALGPSFYRGSARKSGLVEFVMDTKLKQRNNNKNPINRSRWYIIISVAVIGTRNEIKTY